MSLTNPRGLLIALVIIAAACGPVPDPRLTLIVRTPSGVPFGDTVYVAGNIDLLRSWRPDGMALSPEDSTTWKAVLSLERDSTIEFKITRGEWITEAVLEDGSVPANHAITLTGDTTVVINVFGWKDVAGAVQGQITGDVEYLRELEGDGIPTRDAIIWLPPGYKSDVSRRYPVLYMHDGQNIVDPLTSYAGVDWQVDENIDSLSSLGEMEAVIVVGVYNTPARSDEYGATDAGLAYLDFLVNTLKPKIDAAYRTLSEREHTGIMGASMGGTISFLALWHYPHIFSKAACLSPYFPNTLPREVENRADWDLMGLSLYIDNGDDQLDSRLQTGIDRMLPVLRHRGFQDNENLMWITAAGAQHNERFWARRVWRPLLFMFGEEGRGVKR
ncbi:MAG: histidine kinase [Rhodothermales bacterium]|nr:histidine kinase [Rhodothermales bacterium]